MSKRKRQIGEFAKWLTLGITLTCVFWNQPVYRHYKISSKGKVSPTKIIFLSDLHNTLYEEGQAKLIDMIDKEAPDLILFGGDMVDEKADVEPSFTLLKGLVGRYEMYYISGNHEYWVMSKERVLERIKDLGIPILNNELANIQRPEGQLQITGLRDPERIVRKSDRGALEQALDQLRDQRDLTTYQILLSHRPEQAELYEHYNYDLALSGHAHGGQVRVPFLLNGLYAPNQGFFPKYAGGHYEMKDGLDFIVSRGLSFRAYLPRIMNPPEVVVIHIED